MSTAEVKAVQAQASEETRDQGVETGASEEPQAYFEPVIKLDEVEVVSGEEEEEILFAM